jgi:hypothetical protein
MIAALRMSPLFDELVATCGLAPIIARPVMRRALERACVDRETLSRADLARALETIEGALHVYLDEREVTRRMATIRLLARRASSLPPPPR